VAEPAAPATSSSGKGGSFGFLARRIGPVPIWLIAVALLGLWWWYENYGPGATGETPVTPAGAPSEPTGQPDIFIVNEKGAGKGKEAGPYREIATGAESLDQVAAKRHTTAAHIVQVTRAAPHISRPSLERFNKYVAGGTSKKMPAGLVYYTTRPGTREATPAEAAGTAGDTTADSAAAAPDISQAPALGAGAPRPPAGSGGSTSGPAIAEGRRIPRNTVPVRDVQPVRAGAGTRWRTA
jgi:hypothetical protein